MTDRPMIFSAPMVRALLDGRKSQTRRMLKPQPREPELVCGEWLDIAMERYRASHDGEKSITYYAVGDRLWVREAWSLVGSTDPGFVLYRASGYEAECDRHGFDKPYPLESVVRWRSPIHMPRWASRLTLIVESVKVERLQDISEGDAIAEGITQVDAPETDEHGCFTYEGALDFLGCWNAAGAYRKLWDRLHGDGSWNANPWVAAITFRTAKANIGAREAQAA